MSFVVALARPTEPILEQVVRLQLREGRGALARSVAQDLRHRDRGVVVEDRQGHAAEECKGRDMAVAERLGRLGRIGLDEEGIGMRQRHREVVQLALDPADLAKRFAEVHLRVSRRMRQRHEHLPRPALLLPDIVGDDRDAAREPVLVPEPLKNPLRRMPLLLQLAFVVLQDLVDDRNERIELRTGRRLCERRYPGGTECSSIFATVLRSIPKRRAAALLLIPSTWHARRTRCIASTEYISPPSARCIGRKSAEFYSATVRPSDRFR
jgi:hypothetical protein